MSDEFDWVQERVDAGEAPSAELLRDVYGELHRMAELMMRRENPRHTLQPTALVHEAFLRLRGAFERPEERLEYLAAAACAMRRILVDHARRCGAQKRGGAWRRVTLAGLEDDARERELDLVELDRALRELADLDPRQARIVELRFFSGMAGHEVAALLGVSRNTVVRDLTHARAWLERRLAGGA